MTDDADDDDDGDDSDDDAREDATSAEAKIRTTNDIQ